MICIARKPHGVQKEYRESLEEHNLVCSHKGGFISRGVREKVIFLILLVC